MMVEMSETQQTSELAGVTEDLWKIQILLKYQLKARQDALQHLIWHSFWHGQPEAVNTIISAYRVSQTAL